MTRTAVPILVLAIFAGGACGTRVEGKSSTAATAAAASPTPAMVAAGPGQDSVDPGSPSERSPVGVGLPPAQPSAPRAPDTTLAGAGPDSSGRPATPQARSGATRSQSGGPVEFNQTGRPDSQTNPGAPAGIPAQSGRSPVLLASVGTYSGVVGGVMVPILKGAQIWTQVVNERGGLNGHPVKLLVYDDTGDSGRRRAQLREAVERGGAIAFLMDASPVVGNTTIDYIEAKRIPVIGTETGSEWVYASPMYFPQTSSGLNLWYAVIAGAAHQTVPQGKTKFGSLVCVELSTCASMTKLWRDSAKGVGFDFVYGGQASIAQPDFTAECLSARNAGVQVWGIGMDSNSIGRIAAACARQGYHPIIATGSGLLVDGWKDDPNLEGLIVATNFYPYFLNDNPAMAEYHAAMAARGKDRAGIASQTGWAAGKLLERAAASLPEPPTSAAILRGLWNMKQETLGDLTAPNTFTENRTAASVACWFNLAIKGAKWTAPDGAKQFCR